MPLRACYVACALVSNKIGHYLECLADGWALQGSEHAHSIPRAMACAFDVIAMDRSDIRRERRSILSKARRAVHKKAWQLWDGFADYPHNKKRITAIEKALRDIGIATRRD